MDLIKVSKEYLTVRFINIYDFMSVLLNDCDTCGNADVSSIA